MDWYPYEQDRLPEQLFTAIGRVVVATTLLEDVVFRLHAAVLNKSEDELLVEFAGESGSRLVNATTRVISDATLPAAAASAMHAWLAAVVQVLDERNAVVHAVWVGGNDVGLQSGWIYRRAARGEPSPRQAQSVSMHLPDLLELAGRAAELVRAGQCHITEARRPHQPPPAP